MSFRAKIILLLLIIAQLFFIYKGVETVPFFHFGMYSAIQPKMDSVDIIKLSINQRPFLISHLPLLAQEFLSNNIFYFEYHQKNNFVDDNLKTVKKRFENRVSTAHLDYLTPQLCNRYVAKSDFHNWLTAYLQPFCIQKIDSVNYQIVRIKAPF